MFATYLKIQPKMKNKATEKELETIIADVLGTTQKKENIHVNALKKAIQILAERGQGVTLRGVLTIDIDRVEEGEWHNPRTNTKETLSAHNSVRIRTGESLKRAAKRAELVE